MGTTGSCERDRVAQLFYSVLLLVPNISLDVLQPSFPEVLLESHMVMIRVLCPPPPTPRLGGFSESAGLGGLRRHFRLSQNADGDEDDDDGDDNSDDTSENLHSP